MPSPKATVATWCPLLVVVVVVVGVASLELKRCARQSDGASRAALRSRAAGDASVRIIVLEGGEGMELCN